VLSLRSAHDDSGSRIFTYVMIAPDRILKGFSPGQSFILRVPGGTVGDISQAVLGSASPFSVGDTVILFLDGPDNENQYKILDGPLGKFSVLPDPVGRGCRD
jgi:NAD(P)H-flavin reductase